ncbi:anthranilate phosphoribosyltransferase [Nitrospirales bacterium NOB]|nr:MAG: anthranilate phosphoribosyltransferase [Nitrospira sp. OLB3]MBV6469999.1 Anthranilate phosphoribosyltransferase [Nitrospirota bacterium]MCE7964594.1 anthranilate phosphoribosyltransferase [Nitrospira sp. NTP2]MCK6493786.1 anthranilate phosphoribosyltransferase [Nitrospira sp.]MDL1889594.1 anthranilate phosphoribosyltransferase [Nitrospirales bacterium NOB]MEB2338310.1 anthranilate phosphoribosyltransferase [Nitrospirales bacterium]
MQHLLAKVAKGQKTSKDLTWEEAKQAMRLMIEGTATPAQVGAFLVAMRFKSESVTELAAFTAAARQYVPPVPVRSGLGVLDVPTYAGKRETFHALVPAAIIAVAAGAVVLLHGVDGPPDRRGVSSVLKPLGIPVDLTAKAVGAELERKGFAYLDLALYHPPVFRFLEMRQELGVRNVFHPVARLLNPARAQAQVIGLSHPPYFEKTVEALRMLSCPRALVIRGVEGDPELSIGNVTRLLELRDERITPYTFHPKEAGLTMATFREMAGFPPEQREREAEFIARLLANKVEGGQRDWVLLNAAMLLYVSGKGPSIAGSLTAARRALESGQAAAKLAELAATPSAEAGAASKIGLSA